MIIGKVVNLTPYQVWSDHTTFPNVVYLMVLPIWSNYLDSIWIVSGYFLDTIQIVFYLKLKNFSGLRKILDIKSNKFQIMTLSISSNYIVVSG